HTIDAGEWLHYQVIVPRERSRVVLVSQSGESVEIKHLVEREIAGPDYVAITNDENSTLARHAALVLPIRAGDEAAISTKTYTNTLAVLFLTAAALEGPSAVDNAFDLIEQTANNLLTADREHLAAISEFMLPGNAVGFVGRGPAFVAAQQSALTFMEGARCFASAFSGGSFRHGPFEALGPDFRLVVFAPSSQTLPLMDRLGRDAAQLGAHVVLVTDTGLPEADNLKVLRIASITGPSSEDLFPLASSGPMPLLLHEFARARGIEAGNFRYGGKVPTRE
ncbi:MAG: SIS domain-containing protein, partial [Anaerolineae bacterium]|nr:SIS domain-containing protein [Anaerolineae bacterium]